MGDNGAVTTPAPVRPRRRWLPFAAGALTFIVVLVAAGGLAADWVARNAEMRTLITRIEASEAAMSAFQADVEAIVGEYAGSEALSVEDRAALDVELEAAAETGLDRIALAGAGVGEVTWLSWHREVGAAQDAYLAHNRAWQAYLARAAEDPAEFDVEQTDVNTTFTAAEEPLRAALPDPSL